MRFFRRALSGVFLLAVTVGLLALAVATLWGAVQSRLADEGRPIAARERVYSAEVATLTPETVTPVLTAFGEVRSRRTLELRAPAAGEVVELAEGFEDGGAVTAGDLLFRIDPANAEAALANVRTDHREAEAELADAERALELAREDLAAAEAQADLRARALARQQDIQARGVGSPAAVEEAELAAASANQSVVSRRQALASAQSRLDLAGTGLDRAGIALAEAERDLADTEVRAGFDGVLADVTLVAGRLVTQNEQVATLIDADALEVAFRVSTAQYARLVGTEGRLPSAPVRVVLDVLGLDVTAPGVLSRESGAVAEGQSGRLLFARLDRAAGFRVGDFVTVEVEEPTLDGVFLLPATAIDGEAELLVLGEEDRLEEYAATLLRRQGDDVILRAPDLAGREVVLARTPVLGAGIRVNPIRPGTGAGDETAEAEPEPETIPLDPERRARLIAFVESSSFMPEDVRQRMLEQLSQDEVPARIVARIEARMGS
ncbi:HlyD family efflux transporter periplasmic adaptor subunit [Rhodobacterales bacterium HKCCE2091]|nr:HlyD family efflux transporter periplasmic adaptor subunit [Rhodobacterales bacterium HKCCE2091]